MIADIAISESVLATILAFGLGTFGATTAWLLSCLQGIQTRLTKIETKLDVVYPEHKHL